MSNDMTLEAFEKHIAAYGAKSAHWLEAHRRTMLALAKHDEEAVAIMTRAAQLDAALDARSDMMSADLHSRIMHDMDIALDAESAPTSDSALAGDIVPFPRPVALSSRALLAGATALAACFIGGIIMAPLLVDSITGSADLLASLDIISDAFLPTDPL